MFTQAEEQDNSMSRRVPEFVTLTLSNKNSKPIYNCLEIISFQGQRIWINPPPQGEGNKFNYAFRKQWSDHDKVTLIRWSANCRNKDPQYVPFHVFGPHNLRQTHGCHDSDEAPSLTWQSSSGSSEPNWRLSLSAQPEILLADYGESMPIRFLICSWCPKQAGLCLHWISRKSERLKKYRKLKKVCTSLYSHFLKISFALQYYRVKQKLRLLLETSL